MIRSMMRWLLLGFALSVMTGACSSKMRVDDSPMPRLFRGRSPVAKSALGWPKPLEAPPQQPEIVELVDDQVSPPSLREVEEAINLFQRQRRSSGPALDSAWPPFFETMDIYLDQAPEQLSLSPLIRARVAAEFELDAERARKEGCPPELQGLVHRLLARIDSKARAVRTVATTATRDHRARGDEYGMLWPVGHGVITSGFGYRRDPIRHDKVRFHSGIDLAAPPHEPILAAARGTVTKAGWAGRAGRIVRIHHPDGTCTLYAHLAMIMVKPGQHVKAGDVIGLLGQSGRATGPHLHFAVVQAGKHVDPLDVLRPIPMSFSEEMTGIVFGYGQD